MNRHCNFFLYC